MTNAKDLAARLRAFVAIDGGDLADIAAAADLIEQQAAEIERLRSERDTAELMSLAMKSEIDRLRTDALLTSEVEALRADAERLRKELEECRQSQ